MLQSNFILTTITSTLISSFFSVIITIFINKHNSDAKRKEQLIINACKDIEDIELYMVQYWSLEGNDTFISSRIVSKLHHLLSDIKRVNNNLIFTKDFDSAYLKFKNAGTGGGFQTASKTIDIKRIDSITFSADELRNMLMDCIS